MSLVSTKSTEEFNPFFSMETSNESVSGSDVSAIDTSILKAQVEVSNKEIKAKREALIESENALGKTHKKALLIIDVQNDFIPKESSGTGSLAVGEGDRIIPIINKLREKHFDMIALTIDWHPRDHVSFQSNNTGSELFQPFTLPNGSEQVMWPDHCVQNSEGAKLHKDLIVKDTDFKVYKGVEQNVDSYSGFYGNDGITKTNLEEAFDKAGITELEIVGLAYDYCVGFSALDAKKLGFITTVIKEATRGVAPESSAEREKQMIEAGVRIL